MDFRAIEEVAERILVESFRNVGKLRVCGVRSGYWNGAWVAKVIGDAVIRSGSVIPGYGSTMPVELLISEEGRVLAVHGIQWEKYQRAYKNMLGKRREGRKGRR